MTTHWPRPTDWDPVAGSDPTPGNAEALFNLSEKFKRIAATVEQQAEMLEQVNKDEFWEGKSAEAFEEKRKDAVEKLKLVHTRYQTVGEALHTFHTAVTGAQGQADDALDKAKTAKQERDQAQGHLSEAKNQASTDKKWNEEHKDQPQRKIDDNPGSAYARTIGDKNDEIAHYKKIVDQARTDFNNAASACVSAIDGTLNDELKNPHRGWFSSAMHWVGSHIQAAAKWVVSQPIFQEISKWVAKLAMVVGVLALCLSWVPILGQILDVAALVLGAAALVCDLIKFAAEPSLSGALTLGLDVVGLVTFGLGRAAGAAGDLAREASAADKGVTEASEALSAAKAAKAAKEADLANLAKTTQQGAKGLKNPLEIANAQRAFAKMQTLEKINASQAVKSAEGTLSDATNLANKADRGVNGFLPNATAVKNGAHVFADPGRTAAAIAERPGSFAQNYVADAGARASDYFGGAARMATGAPVTPAQMMGGYQFAANGASAVDTVVLDHSTTEEYNAWQAGQQSHHVEASAP
ncbi:MAG: putative T7SS-secreted protein [Mycobacteriales bacterium]